MTRACMFGALQKSYGERGRSNGDSRCLIICRLVFLRWRRALVALIAENQQIEPGGNDWKQQDQNHQYDFCCSVAI